MNECAYCPEDGADVCIRSRPATSGPDVRVLAHSACAERRGVKPLYRLLPERTVPTLERAR
ncbi:hypothetical protein ACIRNI_13325 [Streptomyces sp. NPDC093546]|uniref:hypothetical protein n=1 Tax=Streptomyces sp. NPDC093546 TaxID=3366040 RepID=UPI003819B708